MYLGQHADDNSTLHAIDNTLGSPFLEPTLHSGGGGLVGTIDDYMKFAECLRRNGRAQTKKLFLNQQQNLCWLTTYRVILRALAPQVLLNSQWMG